MGGNGQQYPSDAVGSLTNHIMWTKSLQSGGVVGGNTGTIAGNTYFDGSAYVIRYINPIIVNGKLIYTEPLSYTQEQAATQYVLTYAQAKSNGEAQQWAHSSFAVVADFENGNQHGQYNALLVAVSGTTWYDYTTQTQAKPIQRNKRPTSGTKAMGPNNEFLILHRSQTTTSGWTLARMELKQTLVNRHNRPNSKLNTIVAQTQATNTTGTPQSHTTAQT